MTHKLTTLLAAAALTGGLLAATAAFAADSTTEGASPTQETTADHQGMMGMMGHMSPDHMKQMTARVDGCNRMMTSMGGTQTETPKEHAPDHTK